MTVSMKMAELMQADDGYSEVQSAEEGLEVLEEIIEWIDANTRAMETLKALTSLLGSSLSMVRLMKSQRLTAASSAEERVGFERSGVLITREMLSRTEGDAEADTVIYLSALSNLFVSFYVSPATYPLLARQFERFSSTVVDFLTRHPDALPDEGRLVLLDIAAGLKTAGLEHLGEPLVVKLGQPTLN